jgi:hypothetical protein
VGRSHPLRGFPGALSTSLVRCSEVARCLSLLIEPEAFLRAKQSNPSPVQIPPWIAAALGAAQ